jgi:hypothetical protein
MPARIATSGLRATLLWLFLMAASLFVLAGSLDVPAFWRYLAIMATVSAVSLWLADPDLFGERKRPAGKPLSLTYWLIGTRARYRLAPSLR